MNIIILYALTKVHINKGWNEINILYNYFQLMYFEVGGEILLSDIKTLKMEQ